MILFSPKLFSSSNYIWNVLHAIENVTSSCRPLRSLCGIAMGFIKAGLLLGISMAAKWGLGWNTFCYKCWTLALVVGDLSQRHSAHQIILKTEGWITGQELLRYMLFLPFCPKTLMEVDVMVLFCAVVTAEICAAAVFLSPCFPGAVAWGANRIPAGLLWSFCKHPKLSDRAALTLSGSESGTEKAGEPLLQRSFSFSLQPGCVSSGQHLGKSFHSLMFTSSFWLLFLFHLCCSINQLGLRIWGRSFLS